MKRCPEDLVRMIDHTLLKPDAGSDAIRQLCAEAKQHHFYSVCVNSQWASFCADELRGTDIHVCVVAGFPLGASGSNVKAFEAAYAVASGANEVDMVLPVGLLLEGRYADVETDIREVVRAVEGRALVKVILETGYLNDVQKKAGCSIAEQAGAHYVKTSTGFGPGGATIADIQLMRKIVSSAVGVKASGGVRDYSAAIAMIDAGATRLGTSSGVAIISGSEGKANY